MKLSAKALGLRHRDGHSAMSATSPVWALSVLMTVLLPLRARPDAWGVLSAIFRCPLHPSCQRLPGELLAHSRGNLRHMYQTLPCRWLGVPGGNVFNGHMMPMGSHSDERNPKTWRTVTTNSFPVCGSFPPNVMPEEILSDHPERLRAVLITQSNPLRSYADTTAYRASLQTP